MRKLSEQTLICLDCETTGLEPKTDRIIEIAAARFRDGKILEQIEFLLDPGVPIPPSSSAIHHIMDAMVAGKPPIHQILPKVLEFIGKDPIVGHGIQFDLNILHQEALRAGISSTLLEHPFLDTLRLARHYGESPENSLERLRQHFNIDSEGAHRAMGDVTVNIAVFHRLTHRYPHLEDLFAILSKPVLMQRMPLGKHKGRPFRELPLNYLQWASHQEFDQDLLHSLKTELRRRNADGDFGRSANPFLRMEP